MFTSWEGGGGVLVLGSRDYMEESQEASVKTQESDCALVTHPWKTTHV